LARFTGFACRSHQQVLTERIEHVDVMPCWRTVRHAQASSHFLGKDQVPQLLRLANVSFIASPNHFKPSRVSANRFGMR
jgi:hypothetical protein